MRLPRPVRMFLLLLVLFPAVSALVVGLQTGFAALAWWQWGLIALLPGLAWLWLRYFSVLGCRDACHPQDTSSPVQPTGRR